MAFEENVAFYLTYYGEPAESANLLKEMKFIREMLEERYQMQAHRRLPRDKEKIFAHLVALQLILDSRSKAARLAQAESGGGEMKAMTVGDTRVEFGRTDDSGKLSESLLNQDARLQSEFDRLWKTLIATTRRFLR